MTKFTKDFDKDPSAKKDYTVDWTDYLGADTIATSSWSIPSGLTGTADSISDDDLTAIIWLEGGTLGTDYDCYNTITTAGGRIDRAMIQIRVR